MLLELAGTRTHVVVDGPTGPASGPPVVLCSGLAGTWFDWDAVTALLAPSRTVVRLDRPGYGRSAPWPDGAVPTLGSEVTRLRELLDALDLERAVICAHSMAGFYAEAFAREDPGRTAGLVLLDGSVEEPRRPLLPAGLRVRAAGAAAGLAAAVGVHRIVPALYAMAAPLPERYRDVLRSPGYLRAVFLENARYPALAAELDRLRGTTPLSDGVPVTVAAAYAGRPTPWARGWLAKQRGLADHLDARFAVIAPSGHLAMHDQPAQVAALIVDAVSSRAEPAGPTR